MPKRIHLLLSHPNALIHSSTIPHSSSIPHSFSILNSSIIPHSFIITLSFRRLERLLSRYTYPRVNTFSTIHMCSSLPSLPSLGTGVNETSRRRRSNFDYRSKHCAIAVCTFFHGDTIQQVFTEVSL